MPRDTFQVIDRVLQFLKNVVPAIHVIQPAELEAWGRRSGLRLADLTGLHYSPLTEAFTTGGNVDVNYFAHFRAEAK